MKIRNVFALIFAVCMLLSACGKGTPEAGSQPQISSPETSSTAALAPSVVIDPPIQGLEPPAPINQEVTPKGTFVWNGDSMPHGRWEFVDAYAEEAGLSRSSGPFAQDYLEADALAPVYYMGYLPAILETAPDDSYFIVEIRGFSTAVVQYGNMPDESDDFHELYKAATATLRQRLEEAGYILYPEQTSRDQENFGDYRVITIMSVAEMKALNCGDDLSVNISSYNWPNYA